jgi:hypothetical protein
MFIKIAKRRINVNSINEYVPIEKNLSGKNDYFIRIKYQNEKEEDLHFFSNEEKMNEYLNFLDNLLLIKNEK